MHAKNNSTRVYVYLFDSVAKDQCKKIYMDICLESLYLQYIVIGRLQYLEDLISALSGNIYRQATPCTSFSDMVYWKAAVRIPTPSAKASRVGNS